ncbi:ribose-5-phosphate isomerase RpiA [Candidatus Tachikawaea gelatinosa]|uniref:Ribose-5-phosphate isomerase A n=1 Tax=Candidatus Tachikawaea gelatinosa TaxID=1410383 RepID=A0A090AS42_9ENTR|nr:ribose-5-phosphate isomerase RpiA [Candidatus Tachikawaea gelatinosa]BAP58675.1 ribose-5-phosphate isomerase A [Candidatus Tachikawaea gelatinosa]
MKQEKLKKIVGHAVIKYIKYGTIIGIGSGSTVSYFIDALSTIKNKIKGTVSSSEESTIKLKKLNIPVLDLNKINTLSLYIDGADEINMNMQMIKGGGGALTREKILATVAKKFICIVDFSKIVKKLGTFPLPIEIIPMAKNYIIKEMKNLGGQPICRKNFITDNGNIIIDVHNLNIINPVFLENLINSLPGVVTAGLFTKRRADIVLISTKNGVKNISFKS